MQFNRNCPVKFKLNACQRHSASWVSRFGFSAVHFHLPTSQRSHIELLQFYASLVGNNALSLRVVFSPSTGVHSHYSCHAGERLTWWNCSLLLEVVNHINKQEVFQLPNGQVKRDNSGHAGQNCRMVLTGKEWKDLGFFFFSTL